MAGAVEDAEFIREARLVAAGELSEFIRSCALGRLQPRLSGAGAYQRIPRGG